MTAISNFMSVLMAASQGVWMERYHGI